MQTRTYTCDGPGIVFADTPAVEIKVLKEIKYPQYGANNLRTLTGKPEQVPTGLEELYSKKMPLVRRLLWSFREVAIQKDANGKQTEQFTDVRGRVTAVKNYTTEKAIWTSFKYNAINEQIEAMDDLGHTTFSTYDNFGRRITRTHPDAGQTNYTYDLAGNLTQLETANLIKEGLAIQYTYDFERLTEITYPQNIENNVKYTYGEAGASDNRAGRIVLQEDASGAQEFFYGPLGEVVKNIRTIVIPQHDEQTHTTEWQYDTWNRLTGMTYADGEQVTYTYNAGGLLRSMSGKKKNATYNYVNQLGYDKFETTCFSGLWQWYKDRLQL